MSLINRETLYEKACDLEAQALAYVGKKSLKQTDREFVRKMLEEFEGQEGEQDG